MLTYVLIPLLPLLAFITIGLFWTYFRNQSHWIAVPAVLFSFVLSLLTFFEVSGGKVINSNLYTWIASGHFRVSIGFQIDSLTAVMLLLVTLVSSLVHIYTIGYMKGDSGYDRFFSYLALFTFSMLMLVMANNFLQLYFFWEAVGLCSYLLIAHWYERKSACNAATKAFVVNRVGDFGFGLGILLIFLMVGSLDYETVFNQLPAHQGETLNLLSWIGGDWQVGVITLIALLLFLGAIGKSAQVPLHTWLPDAMEGPTPISALIHAATMVTAGVFMIARMNPIYNLSPVAMGTVAMVGGVTALFGATIALTQNDIKRVVAYSTVSQLGYMIMACGLGAYVGGIFHLLTHGAFKALLFLGCGSVIHALAGEQDLRNMGGLKKVMPVTYITFFIGALALSGIPPFGGFFSKDEILLSAFQHGGLGKLLWVMGSVTAFMTAFYIFRLVFSVFHGAPRAPEEVMKHAHESPGVMTLPLIMLAVFSIITGWVGFHSEKLNLIGPFLSSVLSGSHAEGGAASEGGGMLVLTISILAGSGGILLAYLFYYLKPTLPEALSQRFRALYLLSLNKWYVDELYDFLFVRPTVRLANGLWRVIDVMVIDNGCVNGVARAIQAWAANLRQVQSGQIQHYAIGMAFGALVIGLIYLVVYSGI